MTRSCPAAARALGVLLFTAALSSLYLLADAHAQSSQLLERSSLETLQNGRVSAGLQALYTFDTADGSTVVERVGKFQSMNLEIADPTRVRWEPDGLTLIAPGVLGTERAPEQFNEFLSSAGAVSVEAWVTPSSTSQAGPARIVSLSSGIYERNLTLGQIESPLGIGGAFDVRLRSTSTGNNGLQPSTSTEFGGVSTDLTHVFFTREVSGLTSIYINGVLGAQNAVQGDLSNWSNGYKLMLGNELSGDRPWLGTFHLVAFYNRALSSDEILRNFLSGIDAVHPPLQQTESVGTDEDGAELPVESKEPNESSLQIADVANSIIAESIATNSWPDNADGRLPLGGIFYGNHIAGEATANTAIGVESSRRFRAERTGKIDSVVFQNRVLTDSTIQSRCSSEGSGSKWCSCVNAGLDAYTCGYTLGNAYSVGNGGKIVIELRPDDGSGRPSDLSLGKSESYVPMERAMNGFIRVEFINSVSVEAGQVYHLVYTNLNPPSTCSLVGVDVAVASACPRHQGAIGLNGVYHISSPTTTGRYGPYRGSRGAANLYRRSASNGWAEYPYSLSFYELTYSDGVAVGDSYQALDATNAGKHTIGGNVLARQRFDVYDATRLVDGIWLNFGHSVSADGSPLSVSLRDGSGKILATASMAAADNCISVAGQSSYADKNCRDWRYAELSSTVALLEGSRYYVEFSADDSAGFQLSAYQPLPGDFFDRNQWSRSWAQFSANGGASWTEWAVGTASQFERDLALLFTIKGMPRQLD